MYEAPVITAAEEKDLLQEWFDTVHFDVEDPGIPPLDPENDDEESRANPNHDKSNGQFAKGSGGSSAIKISDSKASDLAEKVQKPDGGFTVNPRNGADVSKGFAVAIYPERSKEIAHSEVGADTIKQYADSNSDVLSMDGNMMGGWHDPASGTVWLDVSRVTSSKEKAIALAKQHNQIAIFDLGSGNSIDTGGTGRSVDLSTLDFDVLMEELRAREPENPF